MKTIALLTGKVSLIGVLVTLFALSCSTEEEKFDSEKTAELSLTISGSPAGTVSRSTGIVSSEGTINRIAIGVFNSDGSLNVVSEYAAGNLTDNGNGSYSATLNCSPANGCSIVAVANAPVNTFAGVNTKTAFLSKTVDLQLTANGVNTDQLSTNLPMSGESGSINFTANLTTNASVNLSRLVARVALNNVSTAFDPAGQYASATFKVTKVFLYNALKTSKVATGDASTTFPSSPQYYHGGTVSGNVWTDGLDFLRDDLSSPAEVNASTPYATSHFFYAFPNPSSNTTKTKLVIAGVFDQDGSGSAYGEETVYYPIVINKNQSGTTITENSTSQTGRTGYIDRNTIYNLTATIKGKGVSDPAQDIEPADLSLTVTVADWALTVTQDVVFE
jgi:hypothetical protein